MEPQKPENQPEVPATPPTESTPAGPVAPPMPTTPPPTPVSNPMGGVMSGPVVGGGMPMASAAPATGGGLFKNKNVVVGIIVAALLVLLGGAYAVYAYVTNTPEYMLNQAVSQFWTNQNAMAAKLKFTSNQGGSEVSFNGDFAFQVDSTNPKNGEVVVGIGSGSSRISITAEAFEEALYMKFGSLQNLGSLAQSFGGDAGSIYGSPEFLTYISKLNDKWWSISKEELQALAKQTAGEAELSGNVSVNDFKQFVEVYKSHPFFVTDKVYVDQAIDGVNSAHFSLKVDVAKYKAFLTAVKATNLKMFPITDQDIADADKHPEEFKNPTFDFWVARDSKKLRQLKITDTQNGAMSGITITFETNLPKLDKIQKPANATPFSQLFQTLFGVGSSDLMGNGF